MIYADHAATTQLDHDALQAMLPWLQSEYGNASQTYSFARKPKKALAEARSRIAACIGAEPDEIFITSGGTESDNWAIKGFMQYGDSRATITSQIEHHAILHSCRTVERLGFPVIYLPVNNEGVVEPEVLAEMITDHTKLVSVMMANNEIGTVEPVQKLAEIAHAHGAIFHTDAVQAVGHIPIDVKQLGVDLLSASAHKFNGPKGVGFLYIKKGTPITSYMDGGAQESHMRAGTENIASVVGMAVAIEKSCERMKATTQKLRMLEESFIDVLNKSAIDYIRNGASKHIPGNVNISIKNADGEMLLHRLDLKGIAISTGSACNSGSTHISHVINAIGVSTPYSEGTIRVSFGADNQIEDANMIASSIIKILRQSTV